MSVELNQFKTRLDALNIERSEYDKLKRSLLNEKSRTKGWAKQAKLNKQINECDQSIRKIDNAINDLINKIAKLEKIENDQILAEQGIDSRANRASAIGSAVSETTKGLGAIASGLMGSGGLSAIGVSKQQRLASETESKEKTERTNIETKGNEKTSQAIMYVLVALVGLFVLMKIKK